MNTSGTMAYYELMEVGFPTKIEMDKLLEKIKPSLENRHIAVGLKSCCLILLLSYGLQKTDFVFGKTMVHFRPGKQQFLDKFNQDLKEDSIENVMSKFKKGFVAFMIRVFHIRFVFLAQFLAISEFFSFVYLQFF